ncbi:hypothetical protein Drorol1_Dr00002995, partial [Drosera rotundifolia]
ADKRVVENEGKPQRWFSGIFQLGSTPDPSNVSAGEDLPDIISLRKGVNRVVLRRRIFPISGCHQAPLTSKPSPFTRSNLAASTGFEFIKRPNAAKPPRSAGLRVPNRLARHLGWAPTGLSPDTFPLPNSFRGPS